MVTIIDNKGFVVSYCENDDYKCNENEHKVPIYTGFNTLKFIKPMWNGEKWTEGASEEEIKQWKEENKIIKQPTTEEEMLKEIANLKIDNMKKDNIINNTLKTVAELKIKVMSMEGGN